MKMGHVVGTKKERAQSQDWYAVIETETLRQLEAAKAAQETHELSVEGETP